MLGRVYVIEYDIYESSGGSFKYAANPKKEKVTVFFPKTERDRFIQQYLELTKSEKDLYIDNIKCYTAILEEITNMKNIIDAVLYKRG